MKTARLNIIEPEQTADRLMSRIARAYPFVSSLYSRIRFQIIPRQILEAIEQHLPARGLVVDVGCGFGLFTLYLALRRPQCQFVGVELSAPRVAQATRAAEKLSVRNAQFICADSASGEFPERFKAAYCTDLLHHLRPEDGDQLIARLYKGLEPGGAIVIKDITTHPRPMLWFTFMLDLLFNPKDSFYYRHALTWMDRLGEIGFDALSVYPLRNVLPYPHFILIGRKPVNAAVLKTGNVTTRSMSVGSGMENG
jgi:SAM-dependent methyltransferase